MEMYESGKTEQMTQLPDAMITGFATFSSTTIYNRLRLLCKRSGWIEGTGRYASLSLCRVPTVERHDHIEDAIQAKRRIDTSACGGGCRKWHAVLDLETHQYVTHSLFDVFRAIYPPSFDITDMASPLLCRLPGGKRRLLFPLVGMMDHG